MTHGDALRALGASAPLVRLASGDCVHPLLRNACLGPPRYLCLLYTSDAADE